MSTRRVRSGMSCLVLASMLVIPSALAQASASHTAKGQSDATLAHKINVAAGDLPTEIVWVGAKPTARPVAEKAQDEQTITCMKKAGGAAAKISPDPFGTVGEPGGTVTVDVSSSTFSPKGAANRFPQVSSEVDFLKTASQATNDLAAFATKAALVCFAREFANLYSAEIGSKVSATTSFLPLTHYGAGNGGVHGRYVITGKALKAPLYDDAYFYVQGRAEILLSFVNLGSPFSSNWASSVVGKVMARAKSVLG